MWPDNQQELIRIGRKQPLFDHNALSAVNFGRPEVEFLIQHRDPFLFVNAITGFDLVNLQIAGRFRPKASDPLFAGHFPGDPIFPGVLHLETMGQLALCLLPFLKCGSAEIQSCQGAIPVRALKIHHATFLAEIRPEDDLTILAHVIAHDDYTAICSGQLLKGQTICTFAITEVYFVET